MKNVLVVIQLIRRGGVENVAINYALHLDKTKYRVSFLCVGVDGGQDEEYREIILNKGYSVFDIPKEYNSLPKKYRYLVGFFKEHHYDIVHSHTIFFSALVLKVAKRKGVHVRVAHSHISMWNQKETPVYKIYKHVMRKILNSSANRKLACSNAAGIYLYGKREYGKNGIFIANGVDTQHFAYNEQHRQDIRREFLISDDEILMGHIGTIYEIKNQAFIVEVLAEYLKLNTSAKLLLVGEPIDSMPVIKKAEELKVSDRVIFAGQRGDVYKIYSAFDIMVFPSLHEGLPVSLIEAQASKLPCLVADTVTEEVKFNDNLLFLSLDKSPRVWADTVSQMLKDDRINVSNDELKDAYDIKNVISNLDTVYN